MRHFLKIIGLWSLAAFMLVSCSRKSISGNPKSGIWRGLISLNDSIQLPFNFRIQQQDSNFTMTIYNSDEAIQINDISRQGDSLKIQMPVFANYLMAQVGKKQMKGYFVKPDKDNYKLPFSATFGDSLRFHEIRKNCCDINEKWAVKFNVNTLDEYPAMGYFQQNGTQINGTFLTETGDYRYLEGVLSGDHLLLSAFDGDFLNYFDARVKDGQTINGTLFSGKNDVEKWVAYRDDDFELRNADSLTYLKKGYSGISFAFQDVSGDTISLADKAFAGKPVIIQIMGSWCPNCMDESRYMNQLYSKYSNQGLRIIGLSFERVQDRETALQRIRKMKKDLGITYPVLLAGATRQDKADEALPMLNHVMSFPTAIFLDRNHKVVEIHTGFTGPGTPVYDNYKTKTETTVKQMLASAAQDSTAAM